MFFFNQQEIELFVITHKANHLEQKRLTLSLISYTSSSHRILDGEALQ